MPRLMTVRSMVLLPLAADSLHACVDDVSSGMMVNQLLLNPSETKVIWCFSPWHQCLIPTGHVHSRNTSITPVRSIRDLGVYLDADVIMRTDVIVTIRSCFCDTPAYPQHTTFPALSYLADANSSSSDQQG